MFGKKPTIDPKTGVNYSELGRAVESALVKDYIYLLHSTKRQIWSSFIRGVFAGLGSVIGATLVVALLAWILTILSHFNIFGIGELATKIGQAISHR